MTDLSSYPADTILSFMVIDIYAALNTGAVSVMYDRPFPKAVTRLELDKDSRALTFIFEDESTMPYGEPIKQSLIPYLEKAELINFFQLDKNKKPVDGFQTPVTVA